MNRLSPELLRRMAEAVSADDRDEMAIPSYLHKNPAMRWMAWRRVEMVADWMAEEGARTHGKGHMLDFGCGTGVLFDTANRHFGKVYGADLVLTPAKLHLSERHDLKITLLHPDALAAGIPDGSLDLVVAAEVLEHVDPVEPTLDMFRKQLKPGGRLLVSLPTEGTLYKVGRRLAGFKGDYHHHNAKSLHAAIQAAGFRSLKLTKIPLPRPLAIYWVALYEMV